MQEYPESVLLWRTIPTTLGDLGNLLLETDFFEVRPD